MRAIRCNAMLARLLAQAIDVCYVAAHAQDAQAQMPAYLRRFAALSPCKPVVARRCSSVSTTCYQSTHALKRCKHPSLKSRKTLNAARDCLKASTPDFVLHQELSLILSIGHSLLHNNRKLRCTPMSAMLEQNQPAFASGAAAYFPFHRNESYPSSVTVNFRKLEYRSLQKYVKRYGINVRPDSTQAELAVACARHFEDVRVSHEQCVIANFQDRRQTLAAAPPPQLDAEEAAAAEADSAFEEPPAPVHSKAAVNGSATKKMKAKSKQKGHVASRQHASSAINAAMLHIIAVTAPPLAAAAAVTRTTTFSLHYHFATDVNTTAYYC
eukprot:12127-Heterococcus_DN1.PRE.2